MSVCGWVQVTKDVDGDVAATAAVSLTVIRARVLAGSNWYL